MSDGDEMGEDGPSLGEGVKKRKSSWLAAHNVIYVQRQGEGERAAYINTSA